MSRTGNMTNQSGSDISDSIVGQLTDISNDVQRLTTSLTRFLLLLRTAENQYNDIRHRVVTSSAGRSLRKKVFTLQNDLYTLKDEIQALDIQLTRLRVHVIPRQGVTVALDIQREAPRLIMIGGGGLDRLRPFNSFSNATVLEAAGAKKLIEQKHFPSTILSPGNTLPADPANDPGRSASNRDIIKERLTCVNIFSVKTHSDIKTATITSIVSSVDGLLLMTDFTNRSIKVTIPDSPQNIQEVNVRPNRPLSSAVCGKNLVAVTLLNTPVILLICLTSNPLGIQIVNRLQTARVYSGITKGAAMNTLIVSANVFADSGGVYPSAIDVISLQNGTVLTSLSRQPWASDLRWHQYLCTAKDNDVLVPNRNTGHLMKVKITTGQQLKSYTHTEMQGPRQVTTDEQNNMFVACVDSRCILVLTAQGIWHQLLGSEDFSLDLRPHAVCVHQDKLYVAGRGGDSSVHVFSLRISSLINKTTNLPDCKKQIS